MRAVQLRPVRPEDLDEHYAQQADPAASGLAAVASRDRAAFDAHWARLLADDTVVLRSVVADGEVVGSALCFGEPQDRRVGYWIARRHWGRGLATEALGLLLAEVAERPLHATVAVRNAASVRVLERHGFVRVATTTGDDGVALHRYVLTS